MRYGNQMGVVSAHWIIFTFIPHQQISFSIHSTVHDERVFLTQYFPLPLYLHYFRHHPIFKHDLTLILSVFAEIISAVVSYHSEDDVLTHHNIDSCAHSTSPNYPQYLIVGCVACCTVCWLSKSFHLSMIDEKYCGRKMQLSGDHRIQHEYKPQPKEYWRRDIPMYMKYQRVMKRRRDGRLWLT